MKTVTERFRNEQIKNLAEAIQWQVTLTSEDDTLDLTPYLIYDASQKIEYRIEDDVAEFKIPDVQFNIWHSDNIWNWLLEHDRIKISIYSGFSFEKHCVFFGYIDKDNLEKSSTGTIFIHALSYVSGLRDVKTCDIFGDVADPPYHVALTWAVRKIFTYIGIPAANQVIKVKPVDTYPDASVNVLSFLYAEMMSPTQENYDICRIDEYKFYFTDGLTAWMIEFNDDYSDISISVVQQVLNKIRMQKWSNDLFAFIIGSNEGFSYRHGATWFDKSDFRATYIMFYDANGNYLSQQTISTFDESGYRYYPMARSILKVERQNFYIILFNGAQTTQSRKIERMRARIFYANTHALYRDMIYTTRYYNPYLHSCIGYFDNRDCYFTFVSSSTDYYDAYYFRLMFTDSLNAIAQGSVAPYQSSIDWGRAEMIGHYVVIQNRKIGWNIIQSGWNTSFFSIFPWRLGRAYHESLTKQIISGYSYLENKLEIIKWDGIVDGYTHEIKIDLLDAEKFTLQDAFFECFTYWRTYSNKNNYVAIMRDINNVIHVAFWSNQFFPFIQVPPLWQDENVYETLKKLAIAGCCIFYIPDDQHATFLSREYWDDGNIHDIVPASYKHEYLIEKKESRQVIVNSGDMKVSVGEGLLEIEIDSDYIPNYDDNIGRSVGYQYYNFFSAFLYVIHIIADALIQFETFDMARIHSNTGTNNYLGRIMKITQEGSRVRFDIRSKLL